MLADDPDAPLIPPIGAIPAPERMFRVNWLASLERSPSGVPLHTPEYVAQQGRGVRIVDLREPHEIVGPLGYIPGSSWVPLDRAPSLLERVGGPFSPIVLVSRGGERASAAAHALEKAGLRMVASLRGGMVAWKALGYGSSRDPEILERRDVLATPPEPEAPREPGPLSRDEIVEHVGDPRGVRWIKLAAILLHGKRSCVDGRDDAGIIGTPGGDAGELVLGLAALEAQLGRPLEPAQVAKLVDRAADALGALYMHTDVHASNELIRAMRADDRLTDAIGSTYEALEWRAWMSAPPVEVRELVLEHMLRHVGCGHLRLMMEHPTDYRIRPTLAPELYAAYIRERWSDSPQLELTVLAGGHREGAVVNVRVEHDLHAFTPIPLISPACEGSQMFVNHPQVSAHLRNEVAAFLCEQGDVLGVAPGQARDLAARMHDLGAHQMGQTLGHLANGLPIYDVTFRADGGVRIEPAGTVGA
ncbi:MAG: rhodanese-like domain-containing protein [Myxococcales bacterium]|nr:rhodanese-like domain-containing protein [Myxococcales bacterium]